MKKRFLRLLSLGLILIALSCNNNPGNMNEMKIVQDSIFAQYPMVAAVTVNVLDDKELIIALGSSELYLSHNTDAKQQMAQDLGAMVLRIFGHDTKLEKATLLITANEQNKEPQPEDAQKFTIDLPHSKP